MTLWCLCQVSIDSSQWELLIKKVLVYLIVFIVSCVSKYTERQ